MRTMRNKYVSAAGVNPHLINVTRVLKNTARQSTTAFRISLFITPPKRGIPGLETKKLQKLDRNTVEYLIDGMQEVIDAQRILTRKTSDVQKNG